MKESSLICFVLFLESCFICFVLFLESSLICFVLFLESSLICFVLFYFVAMRSTKQEIMFLVSLESSRRGGVHGLGSMTFGLVVQKVHEY